MSPQIANKRLKSSSIVCEHRRSKSDERHVTRTINGWPYTPQIGFHRTWS